MLRKIADDLKGKSYAARAREEARVSERLIADLRTAIAIRHKKAAAAIRSVVEVRGTAIIRADSRAGLAELYRAKDIIMKTLRERGIMDLRFTV